MGRWGMKSVVTLVALLAMGCSASAPAAPSATPSSAADVSPTPYSATPTPTAPSSPSSQPTTANPTATSEPLLVPGSIDALAAEAGLPATIAGHPIQFGSADPIPDYWVTTGIAQTVGLGKGVVYLFVTASDSTDPANALGTVSVMAVGYRRAQATALLDAFVAQAKTSPKSACPKCAFTRATVAGKPIVVEAGMPPLRQQNGEAAYPGDRQYAYAHGDILYLFVAANETVMTEVVSALP